MAGPGGVCSDPPADGGLDLGRGRWPRFLCETPHPRIRRAQGGTGSPAAYLSLLGQGGEAGRAFQGYLEVFLKLGKVGRLIVPKWENAN